MSKLELYGAAVAGAGGGEIGGWIGMTLFHLPPSSVGGGGLLLAITGLILLLVKDLDGQTPMNDRKETEL